MTTNHRTALLSVLLLAAHALAQTRGQPAGPRSLGDIEQMASGNVNPGTVAEPLANAGNTTIFRADVRGKGPELGRTDGTAAGTVVFDLEPGERGSDPELIGQFPDGTALISGFRTGHGFELFRVGRTGTPEFVSGIRGPVGLNARPLGEYPNGDLLITGNSGEDLLDQLYRIPRMGPPVPLTRSSPNGEDVTFADSAQLGGAVFVAKVVKGVALSNVHIIRADMGSETFVATVSKFHRFRPEVRLVPTSAGLLIFVSAADRFGGASVSLTDGTANGTVKLRDFPGANIDVDDIAVSGGQAVFAVKDRTSGTEPWRTDGTVAGTTLVKDINPGQASSDAGGFAPLGGKVVFFANNGQNGREPHATDGTAAGTSMIKDINKGPASSVREGGHTTLTPPPGCIYFNADDGQNGTELHVTDGTAQGTSMVKDINPGARSSDPFGLHFVGTKIFFSAYTDADGFELYQTDGTAAGTFQIKDIRPGRFGSNPYGFKSLGGISIFGANDGVHAEELWKSDGTSNGTTMIADLDGPTRGTQDANPGPFTFTGKLTYFPAKSGGDVELYATDGTAKGTGRVKNIGPGAQSSSPRIVTPTPDGSAMFSARGPFGIELHWTDGTDAGTTLLKDIHPGTGSSSPGEGIWYTIADGSAWAIFAADDGKNGREVWRSNGTAAGTTLFADIHRGSGSSNPDDFTAIHFGVMFRAEASKDDREPYLIGGGKATTMVRRVKDINPGPAGSNPRVFTPYKGLMYFIASDGTRGDELWKSDGTDTGTALVKDIHPLRGAFLPFGAEIVVFNGYLYFTADDGTSGFELWRSDGTAAGTQRVIDLVPGISGAVPRELVVAGDRLFFTARPRASGPSRLFVSNGTAAGTAEIPLPALAPALSLFAVGRRVYFTSARGDRPVRGLELWVSDGTPAGTFPVADIAPGEFSSQPRGFALADGRLLFVANDGVIGLEPWALDRPGAHAQRFGQPCGPTNPWMDGTAPRIGSTTVLTGWHAPTQHLGVMLLSGKPAAFLPIGGCRLYVDLGSPFVLSAFVVANPTWVTRLPIPADRDLIGVGRLAVQTLFAPLVGPLSVSATNGVLLTLDID